MTRFVESLKFSVTFQKLKKKIKWGKVNYIVKLEASRENVTFVNMLSVELCSPVIIFARIRKKNNFFRYLEHVRLFRVTLPFLQFL